MVNNGNDSDIESAITSVPHHIESPLRRSKLNRIRRVLYSGQIVYGSGSLPKVNAKALEVGQSSRSAKLVSSSTAKSHKYIVRAFRILSSNIDNEGVNELVSLKKAIALNNWPEWKIAIEKKYNLLMENGTWEQVSPSNGATVIIGK